MSKYALFCLTVNALLTSLVFAGNVKGQESIEDIFVNIRLTNAGIEETLTRVERLTGFNFTYRKGDLPKRKKLTIHSNNISLANLLRQVSKETNLKFKRVNGTIHISKLDEINDMISEEKWSVPEEIDVSGKVTESGGTPLPGVNVLIKGTQIGAITDSNGNFKLSVPDNSSVLVFSFIGYVSEEVTVGNQTVINVILVEDISSLSEVVVIGYGSQEKKDVTGAMTTLKAENFNQGSVVGPEELFSGRIAGLNIIKDSSAPGAGTSIRIRGGTSITASNEPLYVIDGFPIDNTAIDPGTGSPTNNRVGSNPLSMLNPADIESIDVLKDASAAAIYGSRGANGVIIVTTKKGAEGVSRINYEGFVGVSSTMNELDLFSPDEFISITNQVNPGSIDPASAPRNDWFDLVTRDAISQSHTLSISSGTKNSSYTASVGYYNQDGVVKNSALERLTSRLNFNHNGINGRLKISMNLMGSFVDMTNVATSTRSTSGDAGVINNAIKAPPTDPIFNPDGTFAPASLITVDNPLATLEIDDQSKNTRLLGNISASFEIFKGLEIESRIGGDRNIAKRSFFNPRVTKTGAITGGTASIRERTLSSFLTETFFKYNKSINAHKLDAIAGYSYQEFNSNNLSANGVGFPTDAISFHNLGLGVSDGFSARPPGSGTGQSKLISAIFRANYSYNDKYLVTATYRRDGSTKFSENNQWGDFPSLSLAWRLSEEPFLRNSFVDDLKLRVGWGITGNQEIPSNRSLNTFGPKGNQFNAEIGTAFLTGVAQNNFGNPNLTWEETTSINLGLDFSFLAGKVSGTLDVYQKDTEDLLLEASLPAPSIASSWLVNIGEVRNKGVELSLNTVNISRGDFEWNTAAVLAHNKNEVLRLANDNADVITGEIEGAGLTGTRTQIIRVGEPLGTFYGRVFTGIDPATGAETFETVGDDDQDRQIIGDAQPDLTWGLTNTFNYKNWDFSFFLQGRVGVDMLFVQRFELRAVGSNNTFRDYADYWTPENPTASLPGLGEPRIFHNGIIENGAFVKLTNLTLGYRLPVADLDWLSSGRVYVAVQNAFISTDYKGFNPEASADPARKIGIDVNGYPMARTINFGVQLSF